MNNTKIANMIKHHSIEPIVDSYNEIESIIECDYNGNPRLLREESFRDIAWDAFTLGVIYGIRKERARRKKIRLINR